MVAGMFVAGASDNHARAIYATVVRRPQLNGHFRPGIEGRRAAKFNAAFLDEYRFMRQRQSRVARLGGDG